MHDIVHCTMRYMDMVRYVRPECVTLSSVRTEQTTHTQHTDARVITHTALPACALHTYRVHTAHTLCMAKIKLFELGAHAP